MTDEPTDLELLRMVTARKAADRKAGMTLDELAEFVDTARTFGAAGDRPLRVRIGWRNQIQHLTIGD